VRAATSVHRLDPGLALRDGTFDPTAVLVMRLVRKSWLPLLWAGLIVSLLLGVRQTIEEEIEGYTSVGSFLSALLSPLAGVAASFAVRLTYPLVALVLAYPLTRWSRPSDYAARLGVVRHFTMWRDRLHLARGYAALRWSRLVRDTAAARLGTRGRRFVVAEVVLTWSNPVLIVAWLVVGVVVA